ncbi:MAG TPA: sugar-binding domain-containing protein [Acetobacteraceae bacterium]|nr:sugar-binding domain-containing protein [Acetobacteraceae bacterium]
MNLELGHEPDEALRVRAAWLYYLVGLTQEETAGRLGLHRTRVVRLLAEARETGLVSISIRHDAVRDLEMEHAIARRFGLDFCLATPPIGLAVSDDAMLGAALGAAQAMVARRAVGAAAAAMLRGKLANGPMTVGVSWGRTLEQVAQQLAGVRNPAARFVSLMGSLTRNSASNPFEVVQALAARTGGEGHFLPVPFIADSESDRTVLISQRIVAEALALADAADLYLISVGELTETAILRQQEMISAAERAELRALGAVCDTLGVFIDARGRLVDHPVTRRALAIDVAHLRGRDVVLLAAGLQKVDAAAALLRAGLVRGLIIDGDAAQELVRRHVADAARG